MRASKEARTHRRWREQVARLVAESGAVRLVASVGEPGQVRAAIAEGVKRGALRFDVHAARGYAERLIAEGERLERERVVFADWTRTRGLGPENREPFAFAHCPVCGPLDLGDDGPPDDLTHCEHCGLQFNAVGGWPGPLAREWGTVRCEACEGKGRTQCAACDGRGTVPRSPSDAWHEPCAANCNWGHRRCKPCKGRGYVKHPKREAAAANGGAWMIRAGRRLLDTLDGRCPWAPSAAAQPSECQRCLGSAQGHPVAHGPFESDGRVEFVLLQSPCETCRGTGHNLSGTLPPVEVGPRRRCRARDTITARGQARDAGPPHHRSIEAAYEAGRESGWTLRTELDAIDDPGRPLARLAFAERRLARGKTLGGVVSVQRTTTRVVPRGQHRTLTQAEARAYGVQAWRGDEPSEWAARAVAHALDRDPDKTLAEMRERHALGMRHLPRWCRGELRHSEQRRERERRRNPVAVYLGPTDVAAVRRELERIIETVYGADVARAAMATPMERG